ncbi:MAG: MerR family transcriptional regulator [Acidimicrobiales bacterium]
MPVTAEGFAAEEDEYRIDDLAARAGTTVRNVRAYQDRGLLPPPRREGRVGVYSRHHLARLRLIGELLSRGYSLGNIAELIAGWERGQDLSELLGLEAALIAPWSDDTTTTLSLDEALRLLGDAVPPEAIDDVTALGLISVEGDRVRIENPRMLEGGMLLLAAGVPLDVVLSLGRELVVAVDGIAERYVTVINDHLFPAPGEPLKGEDIPRLADLIRRLRPLAKSAVDAELARALERRIQAEVGGALAGLTPGEGVAS